MGGWVVGDRDLQRGALVGLLLLKLRVEARAELLGLFDVPSEVLPSICSNSEVYGEVRGAEGLAYGYPW